MSASTWLAVLVAAAAAKDPVSGAFGLEFTEPVTDSVLAASVGDPPYPLPPRNLDQTLPEPRPGAPSGWFLFRPQALPELLEAPGVTFMVLRDHIGYPVRILAEHPSPSCADDMLWLTQSLARKYRAEDDPYGAERAGFRRSARYLSEQGQVDVSCGPTLLVEYTHTEGYTRWLKAEAARRSAYQAEEQQLAHERVRLERARQHRVADLFTAGDHRRLEGALGVTFGEPVNRSWIDESAFVADEPLEAVLPALPAVVADGRFTLTLGPDLMPVQIAAELPDPDATRFDALAAALEAKYGTPLKDGIIHKIHKVSGDYLVVRYVPGESLARLVFIDNVGRNAQKQREAALQQARLAAQRASFEDETAGL